MAIPYVKFLWDVLNGGGVPALLLLIIWGGIKQWYVPGWLYVQKVTECDKWQQLALTNTGLLDRALTQAEAVKVVAEAVKKE
jgi:hypothetical protein